MANTENGKREAARRRIANLVNAIFKDDILSVILKAHLFVESNLDSQIRSVLPDNTKVNFDRIPFEEKLNLAVSLDLLDEDIIPGCKMLNKLRNKFAHKIDAQISEAEANDFLGRVPGEDDRQRGMVQGQDVIGKVRFASMILYISTAQSIDSDVTSEILKLVDEGGDR